MAGEPGIGEAEQKQSFMVRDFQYGDPIISTTERETDTVWRPNISTEQHKLESVTTTFKLDSKPENGQTYEFGGKYYKVVESPNKQLRDRWAQNSVFVQQISAQEYAKSQRS